MKQHLVWYVLYFTQYQVQLKFCFVWPRWCLSTTFVLSRENNYWQPFPDSQEVLRKCNSKLYLYVPLLAGERKGMQISRSALEVKEQRDGAVVRVFASHQCGRIQILASTPYVGWVSCWFSPLLREVFLQVLRFSPPLKTNISKFSFDQECRCATSKSSFIYLEVKSRAVL